MNETDHCKSYFRFKYEVANAKRKVNNLETKRMMCELTEREYVMNGGHSGLTIPTETYLVF